MSRKRGRKPNKKLRSDLLRKGRGGEHPSTAKLARPKGKPKGVAQSSLEELASLDVDTEMVRRFLCLNFNKSVSQLRRDFADEDGLSFGEASIVSVMLRIYDTGDIYMLNALYDRLIGPVLRRIHMTGERPFADWEWEKLVEEKHRLNKINRHTLEMIEKERKLIKLVEAGEIKPGEYTAQPIPQQNIDEVKSFEYHQEGSSPPSTGKTGTD
jgi:hypothetical protein